VLANLPNASKLSKLFSMTSAIMLRVFSSLNVVISGESSDATRKKKTHKCMQQMIVLKVLLDDKGSKMICFEWNESMLFILVFLLV
jgi:hypothetical protein